MHWEDPDDVVNPTKLVREAWLATGLLAELRIAPLGDEEARRRFRGVARQLLVELGSALSEEMTAELADFVRLPSANPPSDDELRVLQAQIVGWLEGLLAGMDLAALARSAGPSSGSATSL